jgi:glutathione synthase/RimK-type ligase-like ATP-grasp enzyme
MKKLYILTEKNLPNLSPDDSNLLAELKAQAIKGIIVIWDELQVIEGLDILVRTPWDYPTKVDKFKQLFDDIHNHGCRCFNPIKDMQWNLNKRYMHHLKDLGINIIPTHIFENFSLEMIAQELPIVVKPLFGAAGLNTFLVNNEADLIKLSPLIGSDVIIQPFVESILTKGEYSYIFFGGKFSHAVVKNARAGEFRVQDDHGGRVEKYIPTSAEITTINGYLDKLDRELTYVRVDVVYYKDELVIMELEAIEPELFFRFEKNAIQTFCKLISKSLNESNQ